MTRIADLEAEIDVLRDRRAALEEQAERAQDIDIMEVALQARDDITDEICALQRELDDLSDAAAMRQMRRDRAWFAGRTL